MSGNVGRWTIKPPPGTDLDRTHGLCPDHCWPFLSQQGTALALAKAAPLLAPVGGEMYTNGSSLQPALNARYGLAVRHSIASNLQLTAADTTEISKVIPSSGGHTLLMIYRKHTGALGNTSAVGCQGAVADGWYGVHGLPWTSGDSFFRYGGTATEGVGQITLTAAAATAAGVNYLIDNVFVFTTGPRGMEFFVNGRLLVSNGSVTTYTPVAGNRLGWSAFGSNSDAADLSLVMTWRRQLPAAAIQTLSVNPWQVFQSQTLGLATALQAGGDLVNASLPVLVAADGAIAYWRLEETSGTTAVATIGPDCAITGLVTLNQPGPFPNAGLAYKFTSPDALNFGLLTAGVSAGLDTLTAVTVEVWLKYDTPTPSDALVQKGGPTDTAWILGSQVAILVWRVYQNTSAFQQILDAVPPAGQWTHVVGTFDATQMQLFVNGVLIGAKPTGFPMLQPTTPLLIGKFANVTLDEIAVYPTVLSPAQVAAHYATAVPPLLPAGGAVSSSNPLWIDEDYQMVPYNKWVTVTPSDTVNLAVPCEALWVSGAGNLALLQGSDNTPLTIFAPAGSWIPMQAKRVMATNTTATGIVALYHT